MESLDFKIHDHVFGHPVPYVGLCVRTRAMTIDQIWAHGSKKKGSDLDGTRLLCSIDVLAEYYELFFHTKEINNFISHTIQNILI